MREHFHLAVSGEWSTLVPVFIHIEAADVRWWKGKHVDLKADLVRLLTDDIKAIEERWTGGGSSQRAIICADSTADPDDVANNNDEGLVQGQAIKDALQQNQQKRIAAAASKDQTSSYTRAPPPTRLHGEDCIIAYALSKRSQYRILPTRPARSSSGKRRAGNAGGGNGSGLESGSESDSDSDRSDELYHGWGGGGSQRAPSLGPPGSGSSRGRKRKREQPGAATTTASAASTAGQSPLRFGEECSIAPFAVQCWLYPLGADEQYPGGILPIFT